LFDKENIAGLPSETRRHPQPKMTRHSFPRLDRWTKCGRPVISLFLMIHFFIILATGGEALEAAVMEVTAP